MRSCVAIGAFALLAGCGLIIQPNDHLGGAIDADAGSMDAGSTDAGSTDAGSMDSSASIDARIDAGAPDAGLQPECESDSECGAPGVAACVERRCRLCVGGSSTSIEVGASSRYGSRISMTIGRDGANSEIGLAWTGTGNASYLFRTSVVSPSAPPSAPVDRADALLMQLNTSATMEMVSLDIGNKYYRPDERSFELAAVLSDANRSSHNYALWTAASGFSHETYPNPRNYGDPERTLGPLVFLDLEEQRWAIARRLDSGGSVLLASYETAYGNQQNATAVLSSLSAEPLVEPAVAGRLVGYPQSSGVLLWDGSDGSTHVIPTSRRTGRVAMDVAGPTYEPDTYWLAYASGSQLQVRLLRCPSVALSACAYAATMYEIETGAEQIEHVSIRSVGGFPMVLSYEHSGSGGGQLVLRVIRANGLLYDAPEGGREWVIDSLPEGTRVFDARLTLADNGAHGSYVVAWMRGTEGGTKSVRLQSTPACGD
jgi:hypothetical protein